jgi:hypothetical protein
MAERMRVEFVVASGWLDMLHGLGYALGRDVSVRVSSALWFVRGWLVMGR